MRVTFSIEFQIYTCTVDQMNTRCIKLEIKKYWPMKVLWSWREYSWWLKGLWPAHWRVAIPFIPFLLTILFFYFTIGLCHSTVSLSKTVETSFNLWPILGSTEVLRCQTTGQYAGHLHYRASRERNYTNVRIKCWKFPYCVTFLWRLIVPCYQYEYGPDRTLITAAYIRR